MEILQGILRVVALSTHEINSLARTQFPLAQFFQEDSEIVAARAQFPPSPPAEPSHPASTASHA